MKKYISPIAAGALVGGLFAALPWTVAQAAVTDAALATALDLPTGVTVTTSGDPRGFGVESRAFNDFPSRFGNSSYAVLSTGQASDLFNLSVPGSQPSTNLDGEDKVSMRFDVAESAAGSCLLMDLAMGTEERANYLSESVPSDTISLTIDGDPAAVEYAQHAGQHYIGQEGATERETTTVEPTAMSVNAITYWHDLDDQDFDRQPDDHAAPLLPAVTPFDSFSSVETFEVPIEDGSVTLSIADAGNNSLDSVAMVDRVRLAENCSNATAAETGLFPLKPAVVVGHRGVQNILTVDLNPDTTQIERYDASNNGWYPSGVDLRFRWYHYYSKTTACNNSKLVNWIPIKGADRQSFSPTIDQKGYCLLALVTGKKDGYRSETYPTPGSAAWTPTLPIQDGVFTNSSAPTITAPRSDIRVNDILTAASGTFTPLPDTYSYQWFADNKMISGESGQTFKVTAAQAGLRITVRVTALRLNFDNMAIMSAPSVIVTNLDFTSVGTPVLEGTGSQGQMLTVRPGTWIPAPGSYQYEWYADDVKISGQTRATYTPPSSMIGKEIYAVVRGIRDGYNPQTRQTASIPIVGATFTSGRAEISGVAKVAERLTATTSGWAPMTPSKRTYVWKIGGQVLQDSSSAYLTVPPSAVGKSIHVEVRAERSGYAPLTISSALTRHVVVGAIQSSVPRISGTARPRGTLRASVSWKPSPVAYRYQWYIGSKAIKGATRSVYKVPKKYRNKKIRVRVVGTKSGYATVARYSAFKKIAKK